MRINPICLQIGEEPIVTEELIEEHIKNIVLLAYVLGINVGAGTDRLRVLYRPLLGRKFDDISEEEWPSYDKMKIENDKGSDV
ncbi:hypothetical protein [Breznakia pachnodae]|uniref:Uncharacterized protein n=1 Tax=Breznakia pachnodae TaxID=265178 RepID=A0ABU0E6M9_9FIRM|nr:hypothetical protein [Breznakia pachnodae]MDQ0362559.1 hypothetical protein [Breznakia pachnodae]